MTLARPIEGTDGEKRLVKLLGTYARRMPSPGFGFHLGSQEQRRHRPLALVCRVDAADAKRAAACAEAGADAIELSNATSGELGGARLTLPWGVSVRSASFDSWQQRFADGASSAADWITLTMNDDARFLELASVAKVLEVDLNLRPEVLRGVAVGGADVVVAVPGAEGTGSALTVADNMHLRLLCDVAKQPVLVSGALVSPDDLGLRLIRDSGAVGLLLENPDAKSIRALVTVLEQMDDAPARTSR